MPRRPRQRVACAAFLQVSLPSGVHLPSTWASQACWSEPSALLVNVSRTFIAMPPIAPWPVKTSLSPSQPGEVDCEKAPMLSTHSNT